MEIKTSRDEHQLTIQLYGNFDYNVRTQFYDTFKKTNPETIFILDFNGVTMIDSSGIGMLLVLREHAGNVKANITIINSNAEVKKYLDLAHIAKLFKFI